MTFDFDTPLFGTHSMEVSLTVRTPDGVAHTLTGEIKDSFFSIGDERKTLRFELEYEGRTYVYEVDATYDRALKGFGEDKGILHSAELVSIDGEPA